MAFTFVFTVCSVGHFVFNAGSLIYVMFDFILKKNYFQRKSKGNLHYGV